MIRNEEYSSFTLCIPHLDSIVIMKGKPILYIISLLLICAYSYTFMNKLLIFESFQINIAKTGLFSDLLVKVVAWFALVSEFAVISALLINAKFGFLLSHALICVFTLYILLLYVLGRYEECGCGGVLNGMGFYPHLMFNLLLLLLSAVGALLSKRQRNAN